MHKACSDDNVWTLDDSNYDFALIFILPDSAEFSHDGSAEGAAGAA